MSTWLYVTARRKGTTVSKDLTIRNTNLDTWQIIQSIAPVAAASRMFGVTEQQAAIVMLKGHELGLGMAAAFEFIDVIDGKPSIKPKGALAMIQQSGVLSGMKITEGQDDKGQPNACTVWMKRKNGFEFTGTFTMADAKRAELVKAKGAWARYPANMLRWRAIGYVADIVFPDVIGGMYRPEELGADVDSAGEQLEPVVIEAEVIETVTMPKLAKAPVAEPPVSITPEPVAVQAPTLNDLIEQYGAEAILAAHGGSIPATDTDLLDVQHKLESAGEEIQE